MDISEDAPLGQAFKANPYQYFQAYVRNMNNQLFLSEYQINNLYALLLIHRGSPWDNLTTSLPNYKQQVDVLIEKRIKDVKYLLDNLSQLYEDKVKKSTFNQIQRLMGIIKAKNKSIFIQKCQEQQQCNHNQQGQQNMSQHVSQTKCDHNKDNNQLSETQKKQQNLSQQQGEQKKQQEQPNKNNNAGDGLQVFGLISGLGNLPNLSALALGNCIQYNAIQRFIKFKMTRNYIMTIKNDDPVQFDYTSKLSKVPASLFTRHIFPYLTAWELFRARSVCKQWLGLVKEGWHSTFKRQMYIQLLAGQFCKDIQFFYKCIQLRNPFFHKLSLLLHALIQIIQWHQIVQAVQQNRLNMPCKRVILVFLKLLGQNIQMNTFNDLTEQLWQQHKNKIYTLKQKAVQFFSNFNGNSMSINQLRILKTNILDHPFMRGDQMQTQQKTPLLLLIFIKQLNLQQILKNHLHFSQEYLLNSKNRLDAISAKMPQQRGFLQGVYKVLLMRSSNIKQEQQIEDGKQMPSFHQMMQAIFENKQSDKPDFYIRTKSSKTSIYMDRATKLDIILSIVRKTYGEGKLEYKENQKIQHSEECENSQNSQLEQQNFENVINTLQNQKKQQKVVQQSTDRKKSDNQNTYQSSFHDKQEKRQ